MAMDIVITISRTHVHVLFTARKRSLGQGYMFTGVCLSTGGVLVRGCLFRGDGGPAPGGLTVETHPPPRRLLLRAVRILLECILVNISFIYLHVMSSWELCHCIICTIFLLMLIFTKFPFPTIFYVINYQKQIS